MYHSELMDGQAVARQPTDLMVGELDPALAKISAHREELLVILIADSVLSVRN